MNVPDGATLVHAQSGVALWDVSHLLPKHDVRFYRRRPDPPEALFVHHAGADNGKDGWDAFRAMARYHVAPKPSGRNWPAIGYQFGINHRECRDSEGRLCIFLLLPEHLNGAHTYGVNRRGHGLVLQGHHGQTPLTDHQVECLEWFIPWWMERWDRRAHEALGWHAISDEWGSTKPKRSCPGRHAVQWLKAYKDSSRPRPALVG